MKKRTVLFIVVALLLAFALIIGGIAAYFIDTDTKTNTFTIGNVNITLTEPAWTALADTNNNNMPDDAEKMVPGDVVAKDPTVTVESTSNPAYIFVKVEIPNYPNKAATPVNTDIFAICDGTGTSATPGINSGWVLVEDQGIASNVHTYIYAYATANTVAGLTAVNPGVSTTALFDSVKLTTDEGAAENAATAAGQNGTLDVKVTAYGIQTENITQTTTHDIFALFGSN